MTIGIEISFCCNDPDNGNFRGRVSHIALPDGALELAANSACYSSGRWCPKISDHGNHLVLMGKKFAYMRRAFWVGNWCWDAFVLQNDVATQFFEWLHGRDKFLCEGGWTELCNLWDSNAPLKLPEKWWVA